MQHDFADASWAVRGLVELARPAELDFAVLGSEMVWHLNANRARKGLI